MQKVKHKVILIIFGCSVFAGVFGWFYFCAPNFSSPNDNTIQTTRQISQVVADEPEIIHTQEIDPEPEEPVSWPIWNPECEEVESSNSAHRMQVKKSADSTQYTISDEAGVQYEGDVPFQATRFVLVKNERGQLVAGFGNPTHHVQPAMIKVNNQTMYETENAYEFDLTKDGKAFFIAEAGMDETSDLKIYNVETGVIAEHHLGHAFKPDGNDINNTLVVTQDNQAIQLIPFDGSETTTFYPMDGSDPISRPFFLSNSAGIYYSGMNTAFEMEQDDAGVIKVIRVDLSPGKAEVRWGAAFADVGNLYPDAGPLWQKDRWLILRANPLFVLDAQTGEVVFKQFHQDLEGSFIDFEFDDDHLIVRQQMGLENCPAPDYETWFACAHEAFDYHPYENGRFAKKPTRRATYDNIPIPCPN